MRDPNCYCNYVSASLYWRGKHVRTTLHPELEKAMRWTEDLARNTPLVDLLVDPFVAVHTLQPPLEVPE